MLEHTSQDFRALFLLKLTKELIKSTKTYKELVIKTEVKEIIKTKEQNEKIQGEISEIKKENLKKFVSEKIRGDNKRVVEMRKKSFPAELKALSVPVQRTTPIRRILVPAPRIPEPALPHTVSYLTPIATSKEIDLGKLNIFVRDPLVKIIECLGPGVSIYVVGMMGRKPTPIKLSKEEMNEILQKFSNETKIPLHEGLFKAAFGRLVISAVLSEEAGNQFVIRKIPQRSY